VESALERVANKQNVQTQKEDTPKKNGESELAVHRQSQQLGREV
jgi:hypothetical protein